MENEKGTKTKMDEALKTVTETAKSKKGRLVIGVVILVIVFLNIFWSLMESRINAKVGTQLTAIAAELKTVKEGLSALEARVAETEKGSIDLDLVKADVETIKATSSAFEAKLGDLVKVEEAKLQNLSKSVDDQKTYLEQLKQLSTAK